MKKILVGVTGGIGAGKSLACEYFKELGCDVFFADNIAKELYYSNKLLKKELTKMFGKEIIRDGLISLPILRDITFKNKKNQKQVNNTVHPFVVDEIMRQVKDSSSRYIVIEAALIFESGFEKHLDFVINISANKDVRLSRVKQRSNLLPLNIKDIMALQMSDKDKNAKADFILKNNGSRGELKAGVVLLYKVLNKIAGLNG